MNVLRHPTRLAGRPILKMNGIGNAIVVLDLRGSDVELTADDARTIAAMPGFGFDQLMTIHDATEPDVDATVRIYNRDGSRSLACGNGTRCVAWYLLRDRRDDRLRLAAESGPLDCRRLAPWRLSVDMGAPRFGWRDVPLAEARDPASLDLGVDATLGRAFALSMGNPHAVFFVPDVATLDLDRIGPPLETAAIFPERANISFAQIVDRTRIQLRVWERGAGATLACGTGACATLVAAAATGRGDRAAAVDLPGGRLEIEWHADGHVTMAGDVSLERETTFDAVYAPEPAA